MPQSLPQAVSCLVEQWNDLQFWGWDVYAFNSTRYDASQTAQLQGNSVLMMPVSDERRCRTP